MNKLGKVMDIEEKGTAYYFLGTQDRHLVRLFHWVEMIENFAEEVRASEQDQELYDELVKIKNRLTHEVGVRTVSIFP